MTQVLRIAHLDIYYVDIILVEVYFLKPIF